MWEIPYLIREKLPSNTNCCQKLQSNTYSCQKMQKWNLSPVKSDLGCTPVLLFLDFFGPKWLCCQCWWHSSCESDLTMEITFEMLILIISIMMRIMMMSSTGRLCCWCWGLWWCECVPGRSYGTDVRQQHRQHIFTIWLFPEWLVRSCKYLIHKCFTSLFEVLVAWGGDVEDHNQSRFDQLTKEG